MFNMGEKNNNKRIAKNSIYMSLRMVLALIVSLYTTRATLSALGVVDYGIFNVVCGFVSMFTFLNTSLANGIQRFFNYEIGRENGDRLVLVYNSALQIQIVIAIIITIFTEFIGSWYIQEKMVIPVDRAVAALYIFQFSVASMFLMIIQTPFVAAVMAHECMGFFSIIGVLDVVLKLLIVLSLPYFEGDLLIVYGFLFLMICLFDSFAYVLYSRLKFTEVRVKRIFDFQMLKDMLSFSGWNVFSSFAGVMREQGVNMVMNIYFGPIVNAARGIASQVNGALEGFAGNILTPARPQVIQSYAQSNYVRAFNLTFTISKLAALFVAILAVPICIEIDFILKVWIGEQVPNHANTFVVWVLLNTVVNILMGSMATIVHASGQMKTYQLVGGFIKLLPVPVSLFLLKYVYIPEYALISVFIFTFVGYIVGLYIIKSIQDYSITQYFRSVLFPVLAVPTILVLLIYPLHIIMVQSIYRLITIMIEGCVMGCLTTYILALTQDEKRYVNLFIKENLFKKLIK